MRVRKPDWQYSSHGPYLVTRRWPDDRSETAVADTLHTALHTALHWHTTGADQAVAVIDGWGEFVFARSANRAPDTSQHVETLECYELLWGAVPHDVETESATTALFAGIEPD